MDKLLACKNEREELHLVYDNPQSCQDLIQKIYYSEKYVCEDQEYR
jgi:hypothetical protein